MSLSPLHAELTKVWAYVFKNWIMTKRNVFTLFEILFWPVVAFLSVGLLAEFASLSPDMKAFILVGVVAMSAIQVCQLDVSYVLLYDIWSKALKHGFIAPVGLRHLFTGALLMGMVRGSAVFLILMGASLWLFQFDFTIPGPGPLCLFLFGLFLSAATIGMLVCIMVLLFGQRAEVAAWSLVSLLFLLCGIYYPVSILPGPVALLAKLLPVTYFLEYYRGFYGFEATSTHVLFKAYALTVSYLFLETLWMKAALRRAKRTGILLKLSE